MLPDKPLLQIVNKLKVDFPELIINLAEFKTGFLLEVNGKILSYKWKSELFIKEEPWWKFWKDKFGLTLFFTSKIIEMYGIEMACYLQMYEEIKKSLKEENENN
jgi:hypothetical protein